MALLNLKEKPDRFIPMEEVPSWIWNYVYNKWHNALETGWHPELWNRCAMCNWLNPEELKCVMCPLNPCWCRSKPSLSRLHIDYNYGDEEAWRDDVIRFLMNIKPFCNNETNKDNFNWY